MSKKRQEMQSWLITRESDNRYVIRNKDDGMLKGDISRRANDRWEVKLLMIPQLTKIWDNTEQAFAYVRGIEAAVNLIGSEIKA